MQFHEAVAEGCLVSVAGLGSQAETKVWIVGHIGGYDIAGRIGQGDGSLAAGRIGLFLGQCRG